jgi:hypothetical protein
LTCARIDPSLCYVGIAPDTDSINRDQIEDFKAATDLAAVQFVGTVAIRDLW